MFVCDFWLFELLDSRIFLLSLLRFCFSLPGVVEVSGIKSFVPELVLSALAGVFIMFVTWKSRKHSKKSD